MTRDDILNAITAKADAEPAVQALLLSGSLGRGGGDVWSDIDLVMVLDAEAQPAFLAQAESWLADIVPLSFWMNTIPGLPIFSAVTDEWQRVDLTLTVPGLVLATQDSVKVLFDKAGHFETLAPTAPPRAPDAAKVSAMVNEFIRVLGLTPVVLGRKDYVAAMSGAMLQRQALIDLILEGMALAAPPGALSLSSVMSAEDRALLEAMPPLSATHDAIVAFMRATTAAFVPRAQALMNEGGMDWPEGFWAATKTYLDKALGADSPA